MMVRIALVLLLLWPSVVRAQVVTARTGEHATFSRVVLTMPVGRDWSLDRVEGGYTLRIANAAEYDLRRFWERIPRDRIADATVMPDGALFIAVTCACTAEAFLWQPGRLVVDVRDGVPPDDPSPPVGAEPVFADALPALNEPLFPLFPQPEPRSGIVRPLPRVELDPADLEARASEAAAISALEQQIIDSFAIAMQQGVIAPETLPPAPTIVDPVTGEERRFDTDTDSAEPQPGISIQSSIIGDVTLPAVTEDLMNQTLVCLPPALLDVATWGGDGDFASQIADLRSQTTFEFDKTDAAAVLTLARRYVYFGFGREARATLSIDGGMTAERAALVSLSETIDGDPVTDLTFEAQTACPGPGALWGFLAHEDGPRSAEVDAGAVAREFKRLPGHLQVHLAPRLASALVAMGEDEIAETVLQPGLAAERPDFAANLTRAEIDIEQDRPEAATTQLETLTQDDPRVTPEALMKLIDLQIASGATVPVGQIDVLREMIFEFGGTPVALGLSQTEISALIQNRDYEQARQKLDALAPELLDGEITEKSAAILLGTTEHDVDIAFLNIAFSPLVDLAGPVAQNTAARRLLDLGFAERAGAILAGTAAGTDMVERRYLRAEAALMVGDRELARAHLSGIVTDRADALRLKAELGLGPAVAVSDLDAGWRGGDWPTLLGSDDPLLADASSLVLGRVDGALDPDSPLAQGRDMVARSSEARATLDALLDRFSEPLPE